MSWKDCKDQGPWAFTPQENKYGYLNNALWSAQADAQAFCEDQGFSLDLPNQHLPCGHFHKAEVTEEPFPAGRWVAAMQQPGTPYIYVYDILYKAVIRIDTSEIPVFVSSRLELDSTYDLDYDMGYGNPGTQRGGYCMNKDATRIWYLFTKSDGDRSDAELIEVDISKTVMEKVKSTLFPNLVPSEVYPSLVNERINDGCSDDTHTYWCTDLVAGRIIKIKNSDHSIDDDHTFNYAIECGGGGFDEAIATIDVNKNTGKLYWVYCRDHFGCVPAYNACRHLIRADTDLVADIEEVICGTGFGTPGWQNMIRIYSNHILHHRAYYPSTGPFYKRTLDLSKEDTVAGSAFGQWACIKDHYATLLDRPTSGANYTTYWGRWDEQPDGNVWQEGKAYHSFVIEQDYLQNILGVKDGKIFTLMHVNSVCQPAHLYCIDFSEMAELSNLDISYYAGQGKCPGDPAYGWDWTSVSAMNYQTGVIAIFRYHNVEERNYVGCFNVDSSFGFLCDVPLYSIKHDSDPMMLSEPQSWPFEGFTPEIPEINPVLPEGDLPIENPNSTLNPVQPPEDDDGIPVLDLNMAFTGTTYTSRLSLVMGPGNLRIYRFYGGVPDSSHPMEIVLQPTSVAAGGSGYVHALVKIGSKPTLSEYEGIKNLNGGYIWYDDRNAWIPTKDLSLWNYFWNVCYSTGPELIRISGPIAPVGVGWGEDWVYILLYNDNDVLLDKFSLIVSYYK